MEILLYKLIGDHSKTEFFSYKWRKYIASLPSLYLSLWVIKIRQCRILYYMLREEKWSFLSKHCSHFDLWFSFPKLLFLDNWVIICVSLLRRTHVWGVMFYDHNRHLWSTHYLLGFMCILSFVFTMLTYSEDYFPYLCFRWEERRGTFLKHGALSVIAYLINTGFHKWILPPLATIISFD